MSASTADVMQSSTEWNGRKNGANPNTTTEMDGTSTIKFDDGREIEASTNTVDGTVDSIHLHREEDGEITVFVTDEEGNEWLERYNHFASIRSRDVE